MRTGCALLLLSMFVPACAGAGTPAPSGPLEAHPAQRASHAGSRLGPPSPRGLGMRRIDRALVAEAPFSQQ